METFDSWHNNVVKEMQDIWKQVFPMTVGQAQKWLNMYVKYLAAFGEQGTYPRIRQSFLPVIHVPIDKQVLNILPAEVLPSSLWSKINDYPGVYLTAQMKIREAAADAGISAIVVDLYHWKPGS